MQLRKGEVSVMKKVASIRGGMGFAGGRIELTNRRLCLEPRVGKAIDIPLSDIRGIEPFNQYGIVPTGVRLSLRNGKTVEFTCYGRGEAIKEIAGQRMALGS